MRVFSDWIGTIVLEGDVKQGVKISAGSKSRPEEVRSFNDSQGESSTAERTKVSGIDLSWCVGQGVAKGVNID